MQDLIEQPARYLATVEEMLIAERMTQAANVVRAATPRIERTGYDNWNGGTEPDVPEDVIGQKIIALAQGHIDDGQLAEWLRERA